MRYPPALLRSCATTFCSAPELFRHCRCCAARSGAWETITGSSSSFPLLILLSFLILLPLLLPLLLSVSSSLIPHLSSAPPAASRRVPVITGPRFASRGASRGSAPSPLTGLFSYRFLSFVPPLHSSITITHCVITSLTIRTPHHHPHPHYHLSFGCHPADSFQSLSKSTSLTSKPSTREASSKHTSNHEQINKAKTRSKTRSSLASPPTQRDVERRARVTRAFASVPPRRERGAACVGVPPWSPPD